MNQTPWYLWIGYAVLSIWIAGSAIWITGKVYHFIAPLWEEWRIYGRKKRETVSRTESLLAQIAASLEYLRGDFRQAYEASREHNEKAYSTYLERQAVASEKVNQCNVQRTQALFDEEKQVFTRMAEGIDGVLNAIQDLHLEKIEAHSARLEKIEELLAEMVSQQRTLLRAMMGSGGTEEDEILERAQTIRAQHPDLDWEDAIARAKAVRNYRR